VQALSSADIFVFQGFRLDRRGLFRGDKDAVAVPVEIGSRALEVLRALVERPGDLLSRHEIMAAAWPGMVIDDNNLTIQIATLRRVLDRDSANGTCIQTVPGRGYRFVAPVTRVEPATPLASEPSASNRRVIAGNGQSADPVPPGSTHIFPQLQPASVQPRLRRSLVAQVIGTLVLAVTAAGGIWHLPGLRHSHPAPRLSIVVLPFANIGNDPEQQYFADGITEDVTADLSRLPDMLVISRNTAFTYRNKSVDTKEIGRQLSVRYILDGSVRRSGNQLRVSAQLIETESDAHLWAERFDRDIGDLFALQNEITSRIATALNIELVATEAVRPTDNPDALDYILRGRAAGLRPNSRETYAERVSMFEHALALDPQSAEAESLLAQALAGRVLDGVQGFAAVDIARADELARRALAASPRSPTGHMAKGDVLRAQGRCEEAIGEYEAVLAINRNAAVALHVLADCKLKVGSIEEVIPLEEQAIRLSPRDPRLGHFYFRIGHAHLMQSHVDEAIRWLEKARNLVPELPFVHTLLASAYGLKGDTDRAAAELGKARRLHGGDRLSSIASVKAFPGGYAGHVPKVRALLDATYIAGLRQAGMPEE
jgi:TolB-like protein/DNA-binding winged helix-turn-helix (wHTH) protein/Tfp pilus assembly protein PilF